MIASRSKTSTGYFAERPGLRTLARLCSWWASALPVGEARRHTINREMLLAMTSGRLVLCEDGEIAGMLDGSLEVDTTVTDPSGLQEMRHTLQHAASGTISSDRICDLVTCVTEAATNALKYAGNAAVKMWIGRNVVSVVISDEGRGIAPSVLARATLESGFSTNQTLGMGFTLMLAMADRLALHTTPRGTDVLIEIRA